MFERYTEKSRRVIFFARYECKQVGAPAIDVDHVVLGILRDGKDVVARLLRPGVKIKNFVNEVRQQAKLLPPPQVRVAATPDMPLSDAAKTLLNRACEEADNASVRHIGVEHLVLAVLRDEESELARLLRENTLELATARARVAELKRREIEGQGYRNLVEFVDISTSAMIATVAQDAIEVIPSL